LGSDLGELQGRHPYHGFVSGGCVARGRRPGVGFAQRQQFRERQRQCVRVGSARADGHARWGRLHVLADSAADVVDRLAGTVANADDLAAGTDADAYQTP